MTYTRDQHGYLKPPPFFVPYVPQRHRLKRDNVPTIELNLCPHCQKPETLVPIDVQGDMDLGEYCSLSRCDGCGCKVWYYWVDLGFPWVRRCYCPPLATRKRKVIPGQLELNLP